MKMGAWNAYRGLYSVQPAPRQKTAPMTGNPRNPAIYPVTSPQNHLATNEIVTKNEYEITFMSRNFLLTFTFAWTTWDETL